MIEPTSQVRRIPAPGTPDPRAAGTLRPEAEGNTPDASSGADVQTAERSNHATPAHPSFDVQLDPETLSRFSEMRDPVTDEVLVKIPVGYATPEERARHSSPRDETSA